MRAPVASSTRSTSRSAVLTTVRSDRRTPARDATRPARPPTARSASKQVPPRADGSGRTRRADGSFSYLGALKAGAGKGAHRLTDRRVATASDGERNLPPRCLSGRPQTRCSWCGGWTRSPDSSSSTSPWRRTAKRWRDARCHQPEIRPVGACGGSGSVHDAAAASRLHRALCASSGTGI